MEKATKRIVVVGGGSAGWITAGLLAAEHGSAGPDGVKVTLLESPNVPIIGVGEGTWPSMRATLQKLGLSEIEFLRECDASFKQGTEFLGWTGGTGPQRYIHPFSLPSEFASLNLASYWLAHPGSQDFADFVTPQAQVVHAGLAPKQCQTPEFGFNVNYGYHFDAGKFALFLQRKVTESLGVEHVLGHLEHIQSAADGDISGLKLSDGRELSGDLFIDCTGQRSLLLGQHFNVGLEPLAQTLFNNRALAVQVPYADEHAAIPSTTRATAQQAGWVWDIALQSRRGVGYVHSTAHQDIDSAEKTLRAYLEETSPGIDTSQLTPRCIDFEPGYRRQFWVRNCVAVGLSAGFVEPLEASALALVEQSAGIISGHLPRNRQMMDIVARRFNEKMRYHWQAILEFLKLHYVLSQREERYWRDNTQAENCPDALLEKLQLWQQQPPWHEDAPRIDELFPSASYQYVLYGMGFVPEQSTVARSSFSRDQYKARAVVNMNYERATKLRQGLPSNRELLNALCATH
jgi:tryptophan halogenase